ncbi:hypothetical protein J43TS9_57620 [Paenibacillus cineris]|nr:hypothetical protein J43TS9_57620 [Paenibacillus cineris]
MMTNRKLALWVREGENRFIVLKYSSKQSNKDAKEGDHEYALEPMP